MITSIGAIGAGYKIGDTVVLNTGASCSLAPTLVIYKVDANGGVTGTTVDRGQGGICTGTPANPISQTSTSGAGTGLTVNATFGAPPSQGLQGAMQFIAYNSLPSGLQTFNFLARTGPSAIGQVAKLTDEGLQVGPTVFKILPAFNGVSKARLLSEGDVVIQIPPGGGNSAANLWFSTGILPSGAVLAALEANTTGNTNLFMTDYQAAGDIVFRTTGPVEQMRVYSGGGIRIAGKAFASLPTCNPGNLGNLQIITDSNTATWGATIAGGGASGVLGMCNASVWTVVAK